MNRRETEMFVNKPNHCLPSLFDTKSRARLLSVVTNQSRISEVWKHFLRELLDLNLIKVDFNACRFIFICPNVYTQYESWLFELGAGGLTLMAASLA